MALRQTASLDMVTDTKDASPPAYSRRRRHGCVLQVAGAATTGYAERGLASRRLLAASEHGTSAFWASAPIPFGRRVRLALGRSRRRHSRRTNKGHWKQR